jgi:regulator of replication initiation timing
VEPLAAGAVILSAIAALLGGFAALRQRRTEDASLLVTGMRDHMRMLSEENTELRGRAQKAEDRLYDQARSYDEKFYTQNQMIGELRERVAACDADKNRLRMELDALKREVRGT